MDMSIPTEAVEALHAITTELKQTQADRESWLLHAQDGGYNELAVTRAEGERIFADRLAALEAKLKEQGWTRTIRVDPTPN